MTSPATLVDVFLGWVARDKPEAVLSKKDGRWVALSSREIDEKVRSVAAAFVELGFAPGDRIAILSENRPEWLVVDYACQLLGLVTVPLYPTLTPEQVGYILRDSGARLVFVSVAAQLEKVVEVRGECPGLETVVVADVAPPPDGVRTFDALLAAGRAAAARGLAEEVSRRSEERKPDDLATFIYTSGTTGEPKGVMLSHGNLAANIRGCVSVIEFDSSWTAISFLPLSHVYERMVDYACVSRGMTIAYAESVEKLPENLLEVRPHVFVAVPRVYEKIHAKVKAGVEAAGGLKKIIFGAALRTAKEHFAFRKRGQAPPPFLEFRWKLFDRLAYGKIRSRLGGRFLFCLSGGAPLAPELAEFFGSMGVTILEGYGLTETSPVIAVNSHEAWRIGTVGRPLPNVDVRIADDGEIEVRGPSVMKGYWNKAQATAEAFTADGWFRTGDIGVLDADGFLSITDRKKELLVDAYGKNIAPQPIENALKVRPTIAQAVLIGDRRPYVSALVVPDFDACRALARSRGLQLDSPAEIAAHPEVTRMVQADVDAVNEGLANYERIKKFALLPAELTQETGELTPTMKVKRRVVAQKFAAAIASLYEGHG